MLVYNKNNLINIYGVLMKKIVLFFAAALMVAFLSSCSDDTTTSPDTDNGTGLPLAIGNSWKYDTFNTDANGNTIGSVKETYTLSIVGKTMIANKDAFLLTDDSGGSMDTSYIYTDANGIYGYTSSDDPEGINIWIKTIDFKNSKWDIFKVNIDEEDEESGISTKGVSGMKGEKVASSKVTYKGKSYDVQNYLNIIYSDVINTYIDENDDLVSEPQSQSDTTSISLIPGLGIYSTSNLDYTFIDGEIVKIITKDVLVDHILK